MAEIEPKILKQLHKVAKEQNLQGYDIKVKPINSGGSNYTSTLYVATISSKDSDDLDVFIKVAAMGEKIRNDVSLKIYEVENFIYTELQSTFRKLEDKHGVAEEDRLRMCKYFGACTVPMEEVLVLENLVARGFSSHDRMKSVDWEYAASATREMAKLHALSMALKDESPEEFKKLLEYCQIIDMEIESVNTFFESAKASALKSVRGENVERLTKFLNGKNFGHICDDYNALKVQVLVHGDFRPSNMLHRKRDDGTYEIIPVDYQTLRGGCPVVDLLYFIFTGTDQQFRALHYQRLVDHYYSELRAALARLGLDLDDKYPREHFDYELQEKLPFGLGVAIFTLPMLTVEAENAPKVDNDFELNDFFIEKTGSLYPERLNGIVDDFVRWGII